MFSIPQGYFSTVFPQCGENDTHNQVRFIRQSTYNEIKEIICDSEVTELKRKISTHRREHTDQFDEVKRAMTEQRRQYDELRRENAELKAMVQQLLTPESKKSFFSRI